MATPSNVIVENVSRETLGRVDEWIESNKAVFEQYAQLLLWWNRKVNLVSRNLSAEELRLHIKHCLLLAAYTEHLHENHWIDTGTGGGLPGIPFSIVFPLAEVVLNDVVEKKGVVLKDMIRKLDLQNARVEIMDIARISMDKPFSVMTKHAFKIKDLIERLSGKDWKHLVFLKGADYIDELNSVDLSPYKIRVLALESTKPESFFKGKYLLHLCQID